MHLEKLEETVAIPEGVTASVSAKSLTVKGSKGEMSRQLGTSRVALSIENGQIVFHVSNATRNDKRALRTAKAHTKNMLRGVAQGHTYKLKICSGHFPMNVAIKGDALEVKNFIGEKVPRILKLSKECKVTVSGTEIVVESASKEAAGSQAGAIELLMRRPGFDSRIFQDGIYIVEKDGKKVE